MDQTRMSNKPANLSATMMVIGSWEAPAQIRKDQAGPDMVLMGRVQDLLGYKTRRTILEWWVLFPVRQWWEYAYQATKAWCDKPNYRYFLKALMEAAKASDKWRQWLAALHRIFGKAMAGAAFHEKEKAVVLLTSPGHSEGCTCEHCSVKVTAFWKGMADGKAREKQQQALAL